MPRRGVMGVPGWAVFSALLVGIVARQAAAAPQPQCIGDCDGDRKVAINELVSLVNIALGTGTAAACASGTCDGEVEISCLVRAVNSALDGCPMVTLSPPIVFNGEENRLAAYETEPPFKKQVVIPSENDVPGGKGRDLNAQICFTRGPEGQVRFIGGEDTNQGSGHNTAGWGYFELSGSKVGEFDFVELGKLIPTYVTGADGAENYGCGFLSDGRLLTTDVGDQAFGPATGQLIIWFPPFNNGANFTDTGVVPDTPGRYCKLDIALPTAQQIAIDSQDRVYVAAARPGSGGVFRYTGPFPTSDTPEGGCDGMDRTGAPMATSINKERLIPQDENVATPSGVFLIPGDHLYVSSVINGVIAEYDTDGHFIRKVLEPSAPGLPIPTGSPLGIGVTSDGTIYFADIGLVVDSGGVGPGFRTGSVRRVRFVDGQPQPPELMDSGLDFPDGIGILELPAVP